MIALVLILLTASMALVLVRSLQGPRIADRVQGLNALGTITVLWLAAYGSYAESDVVDIAMIYALCSFVATLAVLKFIEQRDLGADPVTRTGEQQP